MTRNEYVRNICGILRLFRGLANYVFLSNKGEGIQIYVHYWNVQLHWNVTFPLNVINGSNSSIHPHTIHSCKTASLKNAMDFGICFYSLEENKAFLKSSCLFCLEIWRNVLLGSLIKMWHWIDKKWNQLNESTARVKPCRLIMWLRRINAT